MIIKTHWLIFLMRKRSIIGKINAKISQIFQKIAHIHEGFENQENIELDPEETNQQNYLRSNNIDDIIVNLYKEKKVQNLDCYEEIWRKYLDNHSTPQKPFNISSANKKEIKLVQETEILTKQLEDILTHIEVSFKQACMKLCKKMKNCGYVQYNIEKQLENNSILIQK